MRLLKFGDLVRLNGGARMMVEEANMTDLGQQIIIVRLYDGYDQDMDLRLKVVAEPRTGLRYVTTREGRELRMVVVRRHDHVQWE